MKVFSVNLVAHSTEKIILFYFLLDLIIMLFIRISLILFHLHSYDYVI